MSASEDIEVTRSTTRGLMLVIISWILVSIQFPYALLALKRQFGETGFLYALGFYLPLISFLGGSAITAIFLGKRKFLIQLMLSMVFSITNGIVLTLSLAYPSYVPFAICANDLFSSKIISSECVSLPFLIIILFDLHENSRLKDMSGRKWALLLCTIITVLLILAYFSYTSIITL